MVSERFVTRLQRVLAAEGRGTLRNPKTDYEWMTNMLKDRGWETVEGVIQKVNPSVLPVGWIDVQSDGGELYKPTSTAQFRLSASAEMAKQVNYRNMPYVYLVRQERLISGLIGYLPGSLIGIYRYK